MDIVLAQPRGFCAGVARAIDIVDQALVMHGRPVYVYHEIVHNGHVVDDLASKGAVFVDDLELIPRGAVTVFSAHGVSNAVVEKARQRELRVIDATCPLVTKVHQQARRYVRQGFTLIVIGHAGHEEVEGTLGSVDGPVHLVSVVADVAALDIPADAPVAYVTQTTLSVGETQDIIAALEKRFPGIAGPALDDICYATTNRQAAVQVMTRHVDLVVVVGARNSSNSNRLREVAAQQGVPAYLVQGPQDLDPAWFNGAARVGVTAGASAPEVLVQGVCERLATFGARSVRELPGRAETVTFRLPEIAV
jgi:4-hydroxy-3-methylbut-2-en-1-yl diphosphate reductase